jgi:hypothetical protein
LAGYRVATAWRIPSSEALLLQLLEKPKLAAQGAGGEAVANKEEVTPE